MPDPRPLASLRLGGFDEPPARSENPNLPHSTDRAGHAMPQRRGTASEDDRTPFLGFPLPATSTSLRRAYIAPSTRRRRRSESGTRGEEGVNADSSGGDEARSRRYKRRKLDDSSAPAPLKPAIRYGWYGQVEPGRLKMELISCDGGEHRDPRHPETSLGPENILRHDKSVYCSDMPSANIILRQADDRAFCLEKLHIVGPDYGFTAPVQEGLVYVAMTMKDLEKCIDPYIPPHARRCRRQRSLPGSPELLSFADALRDPVVNAALEDRQHGFLHPGLYPGNPSNLTESHCDIPTSSDMYDITFDSDEETSNPGDRFVTLLNDEEIGPEERSPQDVLDYRLQRLRLARRRYEVERFENGERWTNRLIPPTPEQGSAPDREAHGTTWGRLSTLMARSSVHDTSSPERDSGRSHHRIRYSAPERKEGDPDIVWTPFSIQEKKHKVTIKFDPPVSGRFVLLKLWAVNKTNVDVQSVVFDGYGGCRFFPAINLR